jgi:hypothetical protein
MKQWLDATVTIDGKWAYLTVDGRRIARRRSGENWSILVRGWKVRGGAPGNYDRVEVEYDPEAAEAER